VATVEGGVREVTEAEQAVEAELAVLVGAREGGRELCRVGVEVLRNEALAEDTVSTRDAFHNKTAVQPLRKVIGINQLPRCSRT
jgi:hypothetical protein